MPNTSLQTRSREPLAFFEIKLKSTTSDSRERLCFLEKSAKLTLKTGKKADFTRDKVSRLREPEAVDFHLM